MLTGVTLISCAQESLLKRQGGNENDIYVVNIPGFDATFKVAVKHFSVNPEAKEPFEKEQETPPTAAPPAVTPWVIDLPDETIELLSLTRKVGLMLRMTKLIHQTGKVIAMDFGSCVSKEIVEMHKQGVYGQELMKNVEQISQSQC